MIIERKDVKDTDGTTRPALVVTTGNKSRFEVSASRQSEGKIAIRIMRTGDTSSSMVWTVMKREEALTFVKVILMGLEEYEVE